MKRIFLMRHGESIQNTGENEKLQLPDHAICLTSNGKQQALDGGQFLKSYFYKNSIESWDVQIWNSPYTRTRETEQIVNSVLNIKNVKEDAMLIEMQFGIFDSISKDKIKEQFPLEWEMFQRNRQFNGKYYARRPGGESPFDAEIRQRLFLSSIFRDFNNSGPENLIIIGHGASLNLLVKAFFHYSHEWYEKEPNPGNCSIRHIEVGKPNRYKGYIYGKPEEV